MTSADRPTAPAAPRAAGVRLSYELLPAAVRSWAEELLGAPVVRARTQVGGMSPGCAVRLTAADGTAAFLKAVSSGENPDTPTLFRHEITVQRVLPRVTYRPAMIASYDDGDWVGMLLEDVEGRYPDFSGAGVTSAADTSAVWSAVRRQARELTPAPPGLSITTAAQNAQRWAERWRIVAADPQRYLPGWAAAQAGLLLNDHVLPLPASLAGASLCHWDVRNDNLLIRPGGEVVIFDWGMARIGPAWADEFVLSLEWAGTPAIDDYFAQITRDHGVSARMLTDMLIGLVGSLAWRAGQPPQPGLPNMAGFADDLAGLLLAVIRRRLPAP